ncbi:MAG: D-alanyl-D-alanine carboxypeptidase/D-alanyl-D-alanine-endopeptidase, partial [Gemmatimonadetes bacterium]|nr:D-alanyl-D-alanine carboxypeptidase/D-alanyl-D-alanine-endopeptidase [Gemmatimonadota bacterium]
MRRAWKGLVWVAPMALLAVNCAVSAGAQTAAPVRIPSPWAALRAGIDSLLDDPAFANAQWGVLVVDPVRGDTLYSRNAGKLFMPASNQKLLTGAVALTRLGPAYQWPTLLATNGRVRRGTLAGDLRVIGAGDPSLSDAMRGDVRAAFDTLARALKAQGITRITGRLVHAGDALPGDSYGFGWAHDDFDEPYSAPVDELMLNEGIATVVVTGGARAGRPARVTVRPAAGAVRVRSRVRTVAAARDAARVRVAFDSGAYVLTGTLAPRDSAVLTLAIREPGRAWLGALREALARAGV